MKSNSSNLGSLAAGAVLILFGGIILLAQLIGGFDYWGTLWPFIIIAAGVLFFVGMLAGGRSAAGMAIPGSIVTTVGLILLYQNFSHHWETWSYAWTLLLMASGIGIFIMGQYTGDESRRQRGLSVLKLGAVMFLIFGAFFETIFHNFAWSKFAFPLALIVLGIAFIFLRPGWLGHHHHETPSEPTESKPDDPPSGG